MTEVVFYYFIKIWYGLIDFFPFYKDVDMKIAQQINESEYAETGQLIECGCCYSEVPFDFMVQCYEGHLFCEDCLKNYANESVFGHGKVCNTFFHCINIVKGIW